jgi:hypothetical protein
MCIIALRNFIGSGGTVLERGQASCFVCLHVFCVDGVVDKRVVRVVSTEINELSLLNDGIVPSVVDSKSNQINVSRVSYMPFGDGGVLRLKVVGKF